MIRGCSKDDAALEKQTSLRCLQLDKITAEYASEEMDLTQD